MEQSKPPLSSAGNPRGPNNDSAEKSGGHQQVRPRWRGGGGAGRGAAAAATGAAEAKRPALEDDVGGRRRAEKRVPENKPAETGTAGSQEAHPRPAAAYSGPKAGHNHHEAQVRRNAAGAKPSSLVPQKKVDAGKHPHPHHHHKRRQLSDRWKVSAWSKAGVSTTVLLRSRSNNRSILLDCGGAGGITPMLLAEADVVLVSHTHADHCAGLFAHARARFAISRPAKYYIPIGSLDSVNKAREAFEAMDGKPLKMEIKEVSPGDLLDLGRGLTVEVVATIHRVPSVGFLLYQVERVLKEEYAGLTGPEKGELGTSGVQLYDTRKTLEVSYSGDTTAEGLDARIFQAKLAIIECTFLDEKDRRLAIDTQHVLLSDLKERIEACGADPDCQLLLMHFSARYPLTYILQTVRKTNLLPKPTACALLAFSEHPSDDDVGVSFT